MTVSKANGTLLEWRKTILGSAIGASLLLGAVGQFGLSGSARTVLFQTSLVVLSILVFTMSALRARRGGHEAAGDG